MQLLLGGDAAPRAVPRRRAVPRAHAGRRRLLALLPRGAADRWRRSAARLSQLLLPARRTRAGVAAAQRGRGIAAARRGGAAQRRTGARARRRVTTSTAVAPPT